MVLGQETGDWLDQVSNEGTSYCCFMPRNRNKYRRQSLTEVRVNGQDIRISPYSAQYTSKGEGEAVILRQMIELVCVTIRANVIQQQQQSEISCPQRISILR